MIGRRDTELACVPDALEHWRRRAIMFADPPDYRRMLMRAALGSPSG